MFLLAGAAVKRQSSAACHSDFVSVALQRKVRPSAGVHLPGGSDCGMPLDRTSRIRRVSAPFMAPACCGYQGQSRQPDDVPPPNSNVNRDGVVESPEAFWNQLEPGSAVGAQMICRLSPTVCTEKACQ